MTKLGKKNPSPTQLNLILMVKTQFDRMLSRVWVNPNFYKSGRGRVWDFQTRMEPKPIQYYIIIKQPLIKNKTLIASGTYFCRIQLIATKYHLVLHLLSSATAIFLMRSSFPASIWFPGRVKFGIGFPKVDAVENRIKGSRIRQNSPMTRHIAIPMIH